MDGYQCNRHAEKGRFDQAVEDVVAEGDVVLHLRPKNAAIQTQPLHADQIRAVNARHIEDGGQERHGKHARPKARRNNAGNGVYRHDIHGFELFGGLHQADFAGHRAPRAAGKQNGRQYGAQFAQEGSRHHVAQDVGRFEFGQLGIALQAQHHADKQAGDGDNQHGKHAGKIHLPHAQAEA